MSQNILETESSAGRVRINAGWDRPLSTLFCNILPLWDDEGSDGDAETVLPECFLRTGYESVAEMTQALEAAAIRLPAPMVAAIEADGAAQAGQVIRIFGADGSVLEEHRPDGPRQTG